MRKIALVGPESSGKTTLSKLLAKELKTIWVPEYARIYLEEHGPNYTENIVEEIGKKQFALEEEALKNRENKRVICDTDLLVIKVWMQVKYKKYPAWIDVKLERDCLYLLCKPDMPWEADALRENPNNREEIYQIYFNLLKQSKHQFIDLEGNIESRLKKALKFISKY